MKIHVLASGSKGNCALLEAGATRLLVDAGLSGREITRRLAGVGCDPDELGGILVTHEHVDHVRGAGILARRHRIPVFLTAKTHRAERGHLGELPAVRHIAPGSAFEVGEVVVRPFLTQHTSQGGASADPVGYVFFHGGAKAGYATDLGHPTGLMAAHLAACQLLVLEFNHDRELLRRCGRPEHVKQWIRGNEGHLSNEQGAQLLKNLLHLGQRLETLVLAHLSEENNTPLLALEAARAVLRDFNLEEQVDLRVAGPDEVVTVSVRR